MADNKLNPRDFDTKAWEIEYYDKKREETISQRLELSVEAVKKADELGIINKMASKEMGTQEILSNMLYIFMIRPKGINNITMSKARTIADYIIDEQEYDINDLCATLIEELVKGYSLVFTSKGTKQLKQI